MISGNGTEKLFTTRFEILGPASYMFFTRIDKFELKYLSIILRFFFFYHDL